MKFRASPNFNNRDSETEIEYIILHYTAMNDCAAAIERLCNPEYEVSSHYIIDKEGTITQLVDERLRAWHAGQSMWKDKTDINSRSIGIELDNNGDEPYPPTQITSLKTLIKDIMQRHGLPPTALLGHSDIAPTRKQDPGPHFPWRDLAEEGLCLLPAKSDLSALSEEDAKEVLEDIGYDTTDLDAALAAHHMRYS